MGRIKKAAGPKHEATVSPAIAAFVTVASTLPISRLPDHLRAFPQRWPFPKGDLYHWIPLLNRFDCILESFNTEYRLNKGPQLRPFGRSLLLRGVAEESKSASVIPSSDDELDILGYGSDGDCEMVAVILDFSRRLLENCGNRSLFSSSERLGDLLNTTSLSLLTSTLQLAVRLAQRYHASRQRGPNASQHLNTTLLASHYNINLDKVQQLANPFVKPPSSDSVASASGTPSLKGKEKTQPPKSKSSISVHPSDLLTLVQEPRSPMNGSTKHAPASKLRETFTPDLEDWGSVILTYYESANVPSEDSKLPTTPTPNRRPSGLSRPSRMSSFDESPDATATPQNVRTEDSSTGRMRHFEIPRSTISSSTVENIMKDALDTAPQVSPYELLTKVRNAHAITTSLATRQELVGIRLLAITNLAYIYPEAILRQKILQPDLDEPRRLQLAYQLADLVHPPGNGAAGIPLKLQTLALGTLEALVKQREKAADVCAALNINVNHGVLFYILRKAVAEMAVEDSDDGLEVENDERREAVFSLLEALPPSTPRTSETLVGAGLLDMLIEVLNLRTRKAERNHPKVLTFLNTFIYPLRDATQSLANSRGLDAISNLLEYDVNSSLERTKNGEGLPEGFRTPVIDYQIPYFQQQTLRMVFKLINHMMTHSTGNFDRLLRNLIDSPQLLRGLRTVIVNAKIYGSSCWSGAINIMSNFIHNEPTSYAVIAEAGLSRGFLEAINQKPRPEDPMKVYLQFLGGSDVQESKIVAPKPGNIARFMQDTDSRNSRQADYSSVHTILPATDAIVSVPQAFGAICLHHTGMDLFLKSGALDSFFKVFESDEHIRSLVAERDLARLLGSSFDELVRHHPNLKMHVMIAILTMIERVGQLCKSQAKAKDAGARLWNPKESQAPVFGVQNGKQPDSSQNAHMEGETDVIMEEAPVTATESRHSEAAISDPSLQDIAGVNEKNKVTTAMCIQAAVMFLSGFFENSGLCSFFVEASGAEYVLDLATLPSLQYDFNIHQASVEIQKVIHMMVEQKPYLILPSLLRRTQDATHRLKPLYEYDGQEGFFSGFTSPSNTEKGFHIAASDADSGTIIVKSLVDVHSLCKILEEVFSTPIFAPRSGHTPFSQANLADLYRDLIRSLGLLHRVCVWEEILLQKHLPEAWKESTRIKGQGMGSEEADEVFGFTDWDSERTRGSESALRNTGVISPRPANGDSESSDSTKPWTSSTTRNEDTAQFRNTKILRYLLSQVPSAIVCFSQNLGKALVPKRRPESYARQNAYLVAEAMSAANLEQLSYDVPRKISCVKDRFAYWIVALTSISSLLIDGGFSQSSQILTLLLQAFKNDGGLESIKEVLEVFFEEIKSFDSPAEKKIDVTDGPARLTSAYGGIKIILGFYAQITMSKPISESPQTHVLQNDHERGQPGYFSAPQFIVELRAAVLPIVRTMWESAFVDKASGSIIKSLIEILRTILEGNDEAGAIKRGKEQPAQRKPPSKPYHIDSNKVQYLIEQGYEADLANESLYRCYGAQGPALEYCQALKTFPQAQRIPIPEYDVEKKPDTQPSDTATNQEVPSRPSLLEETTSGQQTIGGLDRATVTAILAQNSNVQRGEQPTPAAVSSEELDDQESSVEVEEAGGENSSAGWRPLPPPAPGVPPETEADAGQNMAMSIDTLQNLVSGLPTTHDPIRDPAESSALQPSTIRASSQSPVVNEGIQTLYKAVTLDDLDDERLVIRKTLIDRALDVVNVHHDVTFEIADLINAATLKLKPPHDMSMRHEIGEILVQSLISLQMEGDFRPAGKKIASYANLLALVLQDEKFYKATLDVLIENFGQILGFIKTFPDQPADEASPWIGQSLLVIEKILAEDTQPAKIEWAVPADGKIPEGPIVGMVPPIIPFDDKVRLFEAIIELLPRIGRDESLALSVVRVLVILTRNPDIASSLGEKRNLQRLFVTVKQLAGMTNDRLPATFMLLLRHIVEDDDMIRQIMVSEIMLRFDTRQSRPTDTQTYVKQMHDLVIRNPKIFIEVTNEKLEIPQYSSQQDKQILQLKPEVKDKVTQQSSDGKAETEAATDVAGKDQMDESTREGGQNAAPKPKPAEVIAPVIERSSGVIHYLLNELLTYKDVEDKDPVVPVQDAAVQTSLDPVVDKDTADGAPTNSGNGQLHSSEESAETKKPEKSVLKADQHPIYIYRCFIFQCLAELLHCYNKTKIEFINFSRKADPKAMTPSKPRSGVLNYLLSDVIPIGTLSHEETIGHRKKSTTSNWAMAVIVSLCLRTNENGYHGKPGTLGEDQETDLLFVRKFVLEHALKAYKDANSSDEHPDVKYDRILDLAELFNRLLQGKLMPPAGAPTPGIEGGVQAIAKLMFEKNFISALTGSIADIDLNFPGSKRVVKYILRPLKQLTSTALYLSQTSDLSSSPGQTTDEDEISSATSVSNGDEDREETPDLFRNSTLGMFEPGREEESSSASSEGDEEMYDDEYDEGMDYEDGMDRDEDEVISDEEEELGDAGHIEGLPGDTGMDVEVVIDGDDDEPSDEDDDDEDQDDSDDMDDDNDQDDIEVVDEINGDSENASLADANDDAWQDEDGDEIDNYNDEGDLGNEYGQDPDAETAVRNIVREFSGAEVAFQRLEGLEDGPSGLIADIDSGRYMDDVVHHDDENDENDEDDEDGGEEEGDEEEAIYQPAFDDEEPSIPDPPFGWEEDDEEMALPRQHHHHHRPRGLPAAFSDPFPGGVLDRHMPLYRSHRPAGVPRPADDNTNPLLQRSDRSATPRSARGLRSTGISEATANLSDYWVHGMEPVGRPRGTMPGESPLTFLNNLLASVDHRGGGLGTFMGGHNGAVHVHIAGGPGGGMSLPRELQIALGIPARHQPQEPTRINRDESQQPATFLPSVTPQRWQEEAKLLYGNGSIDKALRVHDSVLRVLVPPALERKKREEEEAKKMKEEAEKKKEQLAKEKAEKEEQEKKEKQELEEREAAAAREAEESEANAQDQDESREAVDTEDEEPMEGVESTQVEGDEGSTAADQQREPAAQQPAAAGSSEPTQRVRTIIRGRELDITGLGIDLAYLDALPEDIREEVLMSQLALQRSQAADAGQEPTDISREFLEALPADIREELLQQEAQDRRRREREEARRRQAASGGGPARAEEMDPASFLASLDPTLRQHVLMEQDEEILAHLPEEIAAEARALGGDRPMHRFAGIPRGGRTGGLVRQLLDGSRSQPAAKKPPKRQVVQMLDKAGVATLLRLMFIPQQGSSRSSLNGILHDVSQNKQNRAEVVSLLLSILQDGSTDVTAIERSFTNLSLRAKQPAAQKTPQPLKRALTGPIASAANSMEATPLMVIQQCLSALVSLTQFNPHIWSFFLTEHEVASGMKTKANRKGKGKETKASKFALNALLSLLDRKLIMESSSCMEQLSSLLQSVTHPLTMLLRKEEEKTKPEEKASVETSTAGPGTVAVQAPESINEPPALETPSAAELPPEETIAPMDDVQADSTTEQQQPPAATTDTEVKEDEARKSAEAEKTKKPRQLVPPVVPEENLRLVVNILAARECSAKTFRDTLSTINNLSGIPGAKETFGKGLVEQAQELGQAILQDLDELVPQIKQAESNTDIQGMALTKFSPASSDQAKLLRVLTALDYLFDPKRNGGKTKPAIQNEGQSAESSTPKEDILTILYENPTFGSLWRKLSECLSSIRQADGMLNVATILLPLVEALMVVCKNTTLKDAPLIKASKEFAITSPPPESYMENLFFKFTEDHRKILNDLVRHNPKLMSGTFSLLVKNPKVLEFDNKRNYFTRRLHSRGTEARHPQPPLSLSVRRDQVFLDSFKFLSFKSGDEIKYGKLSIRFHGEEGVDAGGVTREWFQVLSRQMFNPDYALFIPVASDRTTFHPNKLSKVNDEHLMFFKFIGRIIGKALYEGRALDCHFSRAVYKRILGKTVSIKDMETLDLEYYKSLLWMLENDINDILTETFSVETDDFGVTEIVDLCENGRNIPVTDENKHDYVQRVVEYRLTGSVQEQLEQFLHGFHDVVPPELISIFNEQELELLISGLPDIDVDDWKNHTEYQNYQASSPQIQWFWRAVRSFDKEERAKLLQFVTGTSKVPLNGFGQLEGMNGFSRFNIHRDYGNKDRLPSSHTCFNQLDLPEYDSYETLRQQVYTAMTAGSEYFGFA